MSFSIFFPIVHPCFETFDMFYLIQMAAEGELLQDLIWRKTLLNEVTDNFTNEFEMCVWYLIKSLLDWANAKM